VKGRALLYRRGGLGDTLLVFPVLELLKDQGFEVTAVGNTDYFALARVAGWAERVLPEIPSEDFDRKVMIGVDGNVHPFPQKREWVVDHYLREAGFPGFRFSERLPLPSSEKLRRAFIHPSSGSRLKNAPLEVFIKTEEFLCGKGFEVFWLIGEAEEDMKGLFKKEIHVRDILELAGDLNRGVLFVGNDSGFSHLASYLGLHTVVIYGPTDPVVWKPIGKNLYQVIPELDCSPCFPEVCPQRLCLDSGKVLERLFPLLDHILIKINEENLL